MTEPQGSNPQTRQDDRQGKPDVAIRIHDLHKSFGSKVGLDGVNIDVAPAESLVIIGGSGTGKSVLLKHVIGLLKPDSGTVEVGGTGGGRLGNRRINDV